MLSQIMASDLVSSVSSGRYAISKKAMASLGEPVWLTVPPFASRSDRSLRRRGPLVVDLHDEVITDAFQDGDGELFPGVTLTYPHHMCHRIVGVDRSC